ncbi:MAG: 16S rRNA (cytosine(1402)-N(4))-methyltransferase RsmH [Negativibacillus sp.]
MDFEHVSVLLRETIENLNIKPDGIYVDGTAGGAGHSREIAKHLTTGRLIAIDKDPDAIQTATERLRPYPCAQVVQGDFKDIPQILDQLGIERVDGILLDLGVSSHQLDTAERGFSYHMEAKLDMRMSQEGISAYDVVNTYSQEDLTRILWDYSEEKFASKIAWFIVKERENAPIETTGQLVEIIKKAIPAAARRDGGHPAKRTFQAIRIEVNNELGVLKQCISDSFDRLNIGGRFCIITFHSLEDRITKQMFAEFTKGCICPPEFPVCVCGRKPRAKLVTRKPIEPSKEELEQNNRSRSSKLRVLEKIAD